MRRPVCLPAVPVAIAIAMLVTPLVPALAQTAAKPKSSAPAPTKDVSVAVTYKGKGVVDAKHPILVFLFATPDISDDAQPIGMQPIVKNGAPAVFKAVTASPVYIAVAYNETGAYDGTAGPPPSGTPISMYSTDGKGTMAPVEPGPKGKVTMTFDDSRRR